MLLIQITNVKCRSGFLQRLQSFQRFQRFPSFRLVSDTGHYQYQLTLNQ